MPTHRYILENLDCANCAAKIEAKFNAHPQVQQAVIVFPTRQLQLTAEDPDTLIDELQALGRTVESEFEIHRGEPGHPSCDHDHCHCGHDHAQEHHHDHEKSELPQLLLGAGLFLLSLVLSALSLAIPAAIGFAASYLVLGWEVIRTAGKNLVKGRIFDENFLMTLATLGAFAIGEFPEAAGVMLFYRVGEFFEHIAVARSRSQIMAAVDLRPEVVYRVSGNTIVQIPAEDARPGDLLQVRPGDRIPLDGVVVSGSSPIDTSPITGEPVPVMVNPGDSVTSGCLNTDGLLTIRAEKLLADSMVTRILNSVENAAASKPKIDRFIARFARIYTPIVIVLALVTAIVPSLIDGQWRYWIYTALSFLVMSCPCALVLSVPLAFFSGIGAGSKKGILFKGGVSMEAMAGIKAVVMDKTGTLTKGDFSVQEAEPDVLSLCAGCEQHSSHPIAKSIVAAAKARDLPIPQPESLEELPGCGICAWLEGQQILCGNEKLMTKYGIPTEALPESTGGTQVLVARAGKILGRIRIDDTRKPEAPAAMRQLKEMGIATAMLTGDREDSARIVADELGIDQVHARLLPTEKLEMLRSIRSRKGPVMFIGDGINDAPVLAGADVGAAMGSGADAAIEAADVVYMTSQVTAVPESLRLATLTRRIAWQNVVFALAVKAIVMVLGLLGYASMWAAVFADSGVAMLCVLNSIRLLYVNKP